MASFVQLVKINTVCFFKNYFLNFKIFSFKCDDPTDHEAKLTVCNNLASKLYKKRNDKIVVFCSLILVLVVSSCLAVTEYSGFNKPIIFGDFEAQRHWMEITINLPISKWYFYDLDYWGLDYPVLTAYHSWILGKIWVELDKSRGLEQTENLLFMRASVIVTLLLIYVPALILLINQNEGGQSKKSFLQLTQALLFPGLLFIDCSHFQYNHFSLGFFLLAVYAFDKNRLCLGSALFVLALNHKQMELYHALPIAVFLLSRSVKKVPNIFEAIVGSVWNISKLAFVVLFTFSILWAPFLVPDPSVALQVVKRIFPVYRGLFEDKVANFWCCFSIFIKFKQVYSTEKLIKMSTFLVLLTTSPALYCLFSKPNGRNFRICLVVCSLCFFLFSFQVHEKSILLASIPALLLLDDKTLGNSIGIFVSICCFSLFPLCLKDGVPEILPFFIFYYLFNAWMTKDKFKNKLV
ncbi:Alpha-1,3-glucosyltransferase [Meloidogyne graminicola]|uniref:Alpha-1,3-glucosyltransferase n=1 Tax=Meloidogyne graminicola TaxID=189291 RepID=A0A8S9ZUQ6_9BILA|nr:Alpha-1,3-glucosyltransferase [Meloidogyne graminicola]